MTDGLRFQSGLGTNFTRRYKEGQQINTLLLAQVINVNYKYNTVDLMSLQHKEVFQNSYANEGKFSAKLPIEFGGRNIAGQPYGQINPIAVGNIVLVGFINADKNMPIVLSVYNDGTVSNKLTQAPFANADPTDEELQRHTYQKFQVYPSLTYDGIDGEGTRVASFSGKSFFLVSASEERDSGTTDAGYGTNYEDLATSYYNDGELIEPMVPMAPTILFNHQGIEDEDGKVDNHKLLFHIERDGTYRTSMLDKTADWRTFFEMKPDGGVRLRRQGDSIRIDDGFEVGEIGISPDGRVYLRNGDTDLEVRADGLYSNGAPLSVDLSSIYEKLEQQDGKLVSMSTSIIKTDEKVQILADKTEYYDDKIVDYDASFTVMAEMIESKVTATEVQDMIDGAITDFTGEIAKVQADADRANQVISDMASDNRVTPSEKNQLLTEWDLIQNEYPTYIAQAEVYEVSTASYTAKYNAVKAFVEPILADMTATSVVDGTLMRKTFGAYYTERTALLTAILKDLKDGLVEAMQKASQASIDAGEAKADATQATIDANRANALIADIASDGKLTASEKSQLKKEWDIVLKEYPTTLAQANKYEISTADYTAKYTALQTFVTPLLADMSATSVVDGDQLRAVFANYYDARVKLLRSISDSAKDDLLDYGQRIYVAETKITQTSESITLLATKVQSIEDDVLTNTAELKIQAELISQKVTASEVKNVVDSAINDMTIGTSNLYVIYTQTAGLLSETDGTVKTAVDDSVVSDYIKVKASAPYVASVFDNTGSNTIIVAWYDTNKAFISGQAVAGSNDFSQSYKSPSNAVYARVSYKKSKTVKMKFESGTKGSDFSYSWADVKNDQTLLEQYVKEVQEEAQQAQADAENAKNQAENANQAINDMSNDNVLTPLEKQQVLLQWEEIQAEYSKNIDQASKFNVSSTLYASAYSALSTYLTPILADLTSNSIIIGSTMRANFKTYYDRRTTLLNAVAEKAKTLADNAQAVADKADSDLNNIGGYNYVGFSSGDNMLPRLMIDNVGYYTVSNATTAFEGDKVAVTPVTQGATSFWAYDVGSSSGTTAKNGLASYRMGDIEVGKWLTATVNLQAFGTGAVMARLHLFNGGAWTYVDSNPVTPADGLKRVTVQAQIKSNTTAVLIRIYPANTPLTITKFTFSKVQLEVGIRPTPWKKSDIDIQEDINNVGESLKDYVKSRGENLITNGFGDLGNNTNIGGVFDGSIRVVGKGAFRFDTANSTNMFSEPVVVDLNKVYALEYYAKTLNGVGKSYQAIAPLDVDGLRVTYPTTGGRGYTSDAPVKFTKLAKPLKIGDTEIYVEDVSLWSGTTTVEHQRSVVLWGYKNTFGYQYPDGVYSRYTQMGIYNVGAIDTTAKKITLNKPWSVKYPETTDGSFPVGHAISPTNEGATYVYAKGHANITIPSTYTKYTHYLSGSTQFPEATKLPNFIASVQLGFLLNRETTGEKTWINGVSLKDVTDTYTIGTRTAWATKSDGSEGFTRQKPNPNLASLSTLAVHSVNTNNMVYLGTDEIRIVSNASEYLGFRTFGSVYKPSTKYTISFVFKPTSGSVTRFGGHSTYISPLNQVTVDGVPISPNPSWITGFPYNFVNNREYKIELQFTTPATGMNGTTSDGVYIQPNRGNASNTYTATITKFKAEEGWGTTPYVTPAEDDLARSELPYIGISAKDSNNPADYVWSINPDYAKNSTEVALNGKEGAWIYSPTAPSNPAIGVVWVDSSVVPNQPKRWTGAETGWVALTPEEASDIPWGEDGSSLADWVAQAEQRISADSIINTVLGSEDFTGIFDTKADTEDLTNLASYDDLASMQEEYQRLLQEGINGIDFSPYVKNSELEQLKDSFNFTIQQAGGVNMLRNSLGFSGEDFWNGGTSGNLLLNTGTMTSRIVGASTVDTANSYNGNTTIKATWTSGVVDTYRQKTANTPRDGQYTITFWAKADRTLTFNNYFYSSGTTTNAVNSEGKTGTSNDGLSQLTATTAWKRYWITWDSKSATTVKEILLGRLFGTGTIWINSPMLVEGTTPVDWAPAPTDAGATAISAFETTQNDDLANLGFGSGFLLDHKAGGALKQSVTLPEAKAGLYYAVSFYMNIASTSTGVTAGIKVYEDGKQSYIVGHTDASKVSPNGYQRYYLVYEPSSVNTEIEIFVTGASNTTVVISGIMFNIGNVALKWQPYPSEIYNTNVKIDINGITVKNNQTDGYTMITPQEFSGYARVDGEMERIFTLNGETTEVRMLKAEQRITMLPIAIFAMENSVNRGWAFVSSSAT